MLVIMLCLALDHEATELYCLKAASGCLSCDCPYQELASWTRRAASVNQDRIICGLFEQIISNNRQITTGLFAIICGLFVGYLRLFADYWSDYLSGYLRLFVGLFVGYL